MTVPAVSPRVRAVPAAVSWDVGEQAVECAASAGLELDPWQADVLRCSLAQRPDGKWAAFEVGVMVSRQNGKGTILEARELAALFVVEEQLTIHSAHQFDTSLEAFRRLLFLIEDNPDFDRQIKRVSRSHGEEGVELKSGRRVRFRTRTKGGGRGFAADCLILDEAMMLPEFGYGALLPTLSARPNPQVFVTGSAVDQETHRDGVVFARMRERGMSGEDPRLAYFEWSVDKDHPDELDDEMLADVGAWAQANPALGLRISEEGTASELRALDGRTFAVERLGVGDWPDTAGSLHVINMTKWAKLTDPDSQLTGQPSFALDVAPDRSTSAIGVAGGRADSLCHVEVAKQQAGTGWVVAELKRMVGEHRGRLVVVDGASPAASLVKTLEDAGVAVKVTSAPEMAAACGLFFDGVEQARFRHLGEPVLRQALKAAAKRPLGDAWAWSRKNSKADISPLVAATLAFWAAETQQQPDSVYASRGMIAI